MFGSGLVVLTALVAFVAVLLSTPFHPVSRRRVERFARRQSLRITEGNGGLVIGYLATTRRWRAAGLIASVATVAVYSWWQDRAVQLSFLSIFAGWFVGAVIAEWRISTAASGSRRVASLVPRRAADYLPAYARWLPVVFWAVAFGTGVSAAGYLLAHGRAVPAALFGWLAVMVGVGVAIVQVQRHVLRRPQPLADADVLAADDAIRSRTLHVLSGSTLALGGYLATAVLGAVQDVAWLNDGPVSPVSAIAILLAPILGVLIATAQAQPRVRADSPTEWARG